VSHRAAHALLSGYDWQLVAGVSVSFLKPVNSSVLWSTWIASPQCLWAQALM